MPPWKMRDARETSREARARAGIDRNKRVLDPLASASEIDQLAALADVVILPYNSGIPELDPVGLRGAVPLTAGCHVVRVR